MSNPKLTVLSWGLGLQSTALLEMSLSGDYGLPKLDAAIFADTGFEHEHSHQVFDFYAPRAIKAGIKVIKISDQDILGDNYHKVTLPLFVMGTDRQIRRKCTRDYKIRPIQRRIRDLLGVKRRGRLAADLVDLWLGITVDEIHRAKDSRVAYISHQFPLLDLNFKRGDCADYFKARGLPVPKKSSCKFCPFQQGCEWSEKSGEDLALIADLQSHINQNGLVKISGQAKELSFLAYEDFLQADFLDLQADFYDTCDGGFCNS
jgi:hypothetical protein